MEVQDIINIIEDPVHGSKFYTRDKILKLMEQLDRLHSKLEIDKSTSNKRAIEIIQNYIKCNVSLREPYFDCFCERTEKFDENELEYRTAYGALVKGEAMCAGCAEAVRMLLQLYGIKSYTLLSKLPGKNKRLLHYVVVAEYEEDGVTKYEILDPERQANCERKGMDYQRYQSNMIYTIPDKIFTEDVVLDTGLGMQAEEYLSHEEIPRVVGTKDIGTLIEILKGEKSYEHKNNESPDKGE